MGYLNRAELNEEKFISLHNQRAFKTGDLGFIQDVPSYSYFSNADQQFRWRDLYTYGFIDNLQQGVDYPFLNSAHYPYSDVNFRLIPEGINYNENLLGINFPIKPLIDGCE